MRATSVLAFAAAVAPALAAPYFTAPVSGTTCTAGQPCSVSWQDDGKNPTLAQFGDCTLGVYTGSTQQQTLLQEISPANAQNTATVTFIPDPGMGQDSDRYFIKMISTSASDPSMPQYMATAYTSMFSLTGMTGQFNQTVQQQIAGVAASSGGAASNAPATTAAGSTSAVGSTPMAGSAHSTTAAATGATTHASSSVASRASASASATSTTNGASSVVVAGVGMFGATVLAVLAAVVF